MEKQYIDRSKLNEILRLLNLNYTQLGKLMGVVTSGFPSQNAWGGIHGTGNSIPG